MSIEITNNGISSQAPNAGDEAQQGKAQRNATNAKVETGRPVDSVQLTENAKAMNKLQNAISSLPVVDSSKVEAAMSKVKNRSLDILGKTEERLASAERIADKILALEEDLPEQGTDSKA